jgi:hypothetical protein
MLQSQAVEWLAHFVGPSPSVILEFPRCIRERTVKEKDSKRQGGLFSHCIAATRKPIHVERAVRKERHASRFAMDRDSSRGELDLLDPPRRLA